MVYQKDYQRPQKYKMRHKKISVRSCEPHEYWKVFGDASETRTRDTLIKSQVLYQLS